MNNTLGIVLFAVMILVVFTITYKLLPFKKHQGIKPKLTFFPKYVASFDKPLDEIETALVVLGFKATADPCYYYRGKVYSDVAAKSIKLSVTINAEEQQIKVQTSFLGILFDMGGMWQVTNDIIHTDYGIRH